MNDPLVPTPDGSDRTRFPEPGLEAADDPNQVIECVAFRFGWNRRRFVEVLGAGLLISVPASSALAQNRGAGGRPRGDGGAGVPVSARIHLGENGTATVLTGKVEMGQGARAEITQAAAEELRLPPGRVQLLMADTAVVPGVVVVRDGDFVGVAAPTTHLAEKAVDVLAATARWEIKEHLSSGALFEHLRQTAQGGVPPNPFRDEVAKAPKSLKSTFQVAYVQHAPMETRTALAEWGDDGQLSVWTGTQNPFGYQSELDIHLLNRPDLPSVGGGETPLVAVAPAISNALFHATGRRLRSLPLRLEPAAADADRPA